MESLAGTDVVPRLVAERPRPEWRLGALTVVVGPDRAQLRYAREPVGSAAPTARDITIAWRRALDRLAERSRAPDALLPALVAAYRDVLAGKPVGERVALVAV